MVKHLEVATVMIEPLTKVPRLMYVAQRRPVYDDHREFKPFATPRDILELGIFDGKYFIESKLPAGYTITPKNMFAPRVSKPLSYWQARGWIKHHDKKGWFQWFVNFHHGRRIEGYDAWQIDRHNNFAARHGSAVRKLGEGVLSRRRRQRQALLHWAVWPIPDLELIPERSIK